ncbi:hypothetical protein [Pseudomonas syringae]
MGMLERHPLGSQAFTFPDCAG